MWLGSLSFFPLCVCCWKSTIIEENEQLSLKSGLKDNNPMHHNLCNKHEYGILNYQKFKGHIRASLEPRGASIGCRQRL